MVRTNMAVGHDGQLPGAVQPSKSEENKKRRIKIEADSAPVVDTMSSKVGIDRKDWNTKNLSQRLVVDAGCAVAAGFGVAPIVSMVDK